MGYIEGTSRDQIMFVNLEEMIPADSECRVIDCFCDKLNMVQMGFEHATTKEEGRPPFAPEVLLKLFLYGYLNHIASCGRLSREATRNIEVMWLLNGMTPSKRTLCYFKEHNKAAMRKVFSSFNRFYREIGLFGKQTVALDSVKVKANNSKKKNHNKDTIEKTLKKTEARIDEYLALLDEADRNEGYEEERDLTSEQIQEILKKLNAKKEKFEQLEKELQESEETQISTTDPDSRCMKQGSGKGMDVSYNTQVVTEAESKMIVDYETTNSGSDKGHLTEMANKAKEFLETDKITLLADTGYHEGKEMLEAETSNVTCLIPKAKPSNQNGEEGYSRDKFIYDPECNIYVCPAHQVLKFMRKKTDTNGDEAFIYANYHACANCPNRSKCTKAKYREISRKAFQTQVDELDKRFLKCKGEYKKRQEIVEHPFGTIKWVWGFDRYLTRGIQSADAENALVFSAYNMRRAINMIGVEKLIEAMCAYAAKISSVHSHISMIFLSFVTSLVPNRQSYDRIII